MPLHNIPLCKFSYARELYNTAKFKYDTRQNIIKNKTKLFYKNNGTKIDKIDSKMFYSTKTKIDKIY